MSTVWPVFLCWEEVRQQTDSRQFNEPWLFLHFPSGHAANGQFTRQRHKCCWVSPKQTLVNGGQYVSSVYTQNGTSQICMQDREVSRKMSKMVLDLVLPAHQLRNLEYIL